jgi:hypothetical protein
MQLTALGLVDLFFVMFCLPLFILLAVNFAPLLLIPGFGLIGFILMALLYIIAVLILLWTGIKVIWALLKAFVNILLLTIFAPIQIALGTVIPSLDFGSWLKNYASNLAVFVVTGALFLFSFLFIIEGVSISLSGSVPVAVISAILDPLLGTNTPNLSPFASGAWPPLLGAGSATWTGLLFFGVAFVLFTLTPKANEIIQGLLSGKPFTYGTAIGEAFGPVSGPAGVAGKYAQGAALGVGGTYAGQALGNVYAGMTTEQQQKWYAGLLDELSKALQNQKH